MTRLSAIQMTSGADVNENLASVALFIAQAKEQESQLAVLPEMFPMMGAESPARLKISETFGHGLIQDHISQLAKQYAIWIVAGTIPLKTADANKIAAACLVFDNHGNIVARYDKIHLFDVKINDTESYQESTTIEAGDQVSVIDTPCGKLGLSVCYDIRFPELYRRMMNLGAEIFSIPAAFTVKTGKAHWELLARSRAVENICYVVGACQVGNHNHSRQTYGHSLIVNPWGDVIQALTSQVGVITADIDLDALQTLRKNMPIAKHQRIE